MKRLFIFVCGVSFVASAQQYTTEVFIQGTGLHAIHGLTFDAEDRLYAGSVVGQAVYRIDTQTGRHEVVAGPPEGLADDMEFGPDGSLTWTSIIQGFVRAKKADGPIRVLAQGLPGANSVAYNAQGRLFVGEVFLGDALHEIDPAGVKPPRKILENIGGLNGFDFGPDGFLYGPLWFKGQVIKVNVDSGESAVVAEGFKIPAAANFDGKGNLYVLDSGRGEIVRVDVKSGGKTVVSKFQTAMDNLAFDSKDNLYVTVMSESAVYQIDTATGQSRLVRRDPLAIPADLAIWRDGDRETLYVADTFALRAIDTGTRAITDVARFVETDLEYPTGIDVSERFVHTTSWFGRVVQTFDRKTHELIHTYHDFQVPFDVLELPDGALLVAQLGAGNVVMVKSGPERSVAIDNLVTPVSLARGNDGRIYISQFAAGQIVAVDLATGAREVVARDLQGPEGIAFDARGRLLVAEVTAKSLSAIDLSSGNKETLAKDLHIGLQLSPGLPPMGATTGVAVSSSGAVYVSADLTDSIYRVSRN